jgi:thymidylate synthase ThyX
MISAKIITDSKNEFGNRITTMVVTFPRFILAEFNTHRMFSRNSASSRAIPFEKMLKSVEENPFIPIAWQKDHKGMQGTEYYTDDNSIETLKANWLGARDYAVSHAKALSDFQLTKQLCNRLLEPFMHHTVIVTATEWENFFALRCPQYTDGKGKVYRSKKDYCNNYNTKPDNEVIKEDKLFWFNQNKGQAEIHMMQLAECMWDAYNESTPKELKAGEWHIPFGDNLNVEQISKIIGIKGMQPNQSLDNQEDIAIRAVEHGLIFDEIAIKIATARCARVSYTVVGEEDKEPNYEADIKLHDRLRDAGHMSPFEHCAQAMEYREVNDEFVTGFSGNFKGFTQYRKTLPNENISK